ncbi:MAG TPA: FAD:protein FMN transferase [Planctomycetota bacterium]|nr:FAD:protein FMN transferase [Planctomycetota bacterium]
MPLYSRRKFLMLASGAGGLAMFGLAARLQRDYNLREFKRTSYALGADVHLTVLHADEEVARVALNAAFDELDLIEDCISVYRAHSDISRLNRQGKIEHPHAHFLTVLNAGQKMAEQSNGAFDATVQPLWDLYFAAKKNDALPSVEAIAAVRAKVDWRDISVSGERVEFKTPGTKITFNGIGQGFAADRVLAVLKAHGIEHALIDAGEYTCEGRKADGSKFRVGIAHPRKPDALIAVCEMDGRALATSGDYETYFSDDFLYNHIFDPATGVSPRELASVTVVAPTGILADALTKPVFIFGREKGLALVESMPGCDAFVVTKDGATAHTRGFPLAG